MSASPPPAASPGLGLFGYGHEAFASDAGERDAAAVGKGAAASAVRAAARSATEELARLRDDNTALTTRAVQAEHRESALAQASKTEKDALEARAQRRPRATRVRMGRRRGSSDCVA